MAARIERAKTTTPTQSAQGMGSSTGMPSGGIAVGVGVGVEASSSAQQQQQQGQAAIHAPLPTRRMLSQLLRQWQQSFPQPSPSQTTTTTTTTTNTTTNPSQQQQTSPTKEPTSTTSPTIPTTTTTTTTTTIPETPKTVVTYPDFPQLTPQQSRTPSRLVGVSPQQTTSPHLQITTPTHTRRASITTFLPTEALLMSPIPRARNPGGFRRGGDAEEGTAMVMPFGEVVGLVGGWEDKMRSATAWAVVNTTIPPAGDESREEEEGEGEVQVEEGEAASGGS